VHYEYDLDQYGKNMPLGPVKLSYQAIQLASTSDESRDAILVAPNDYHFPS